MSPTTTTQPDPPYVDGSGMIQVPGLTIDRIHENFEGIEPNPPGLLDHLLGIDPTPVAPSGTSPWFWLATAAVVTLAVIVIAVLIVVTRHSDEVAERRWRQQFADERNAPVNLDAESER